MFLILWFSVLYAIISTSTIKENPMISSCPKYGSWVGNTLFSSVLYYLEGFLVFSSGATFHRKPYLLLHHFMLLIYISVALCVQVWLDKDCSCCLVCLGDGLVCSFSWWPHIYTIMYQPILDACLPTSFWCVLTHISLSGATVGFVLGLFLFVCSGRIALFWFSSSMWNWTKAVCLSHLMILGN